MKAEESQQPLVSVIIITYNSSEYVLETLESAKAQTYKNIELIVSDDCSTDNTIEVCQTWIKNNSKFFRRTELIKTEKNTGVPGNCNRGLQKATGEWIKIIAGDDILLENCILDNIQYSQNQSGVEVIFSDRISFKNDFNEENFLKPGKKSLLHNNNLSPKQQFQLILRGTRCPAVTLFVKKDVFTKVGLYDEAFRKIEDIPMLIKVSRSGIKIHYLNKTTVAYRIHSASITQKSKKKVIYNDFEIQSLYPVHLKYIESNLPLLERLVVRYEFFFKRLFYNTKLNDYNLFNRALSKILVTPKLLIQNSVIRKIKKDLNQLNNSSL